MIDNILDRASAIVTQPHELRETALRYAEVVEGQMDEVNESVKAYTVREPIRALGIAFGLGAFVEWMIKRR